MLLCLPCGGVVSGFGGSVLAGLKSFGEGGAWCRRTDESGQRRPSSWLGPSTRGAFGVDMGYGLASGHGAMNRRS